MLGNYEVKKAEDIRYRDLEKIVSEFFGKRDFENFISKERIGYSRYTKEYWLKEYERGNIFVLKDNPFSPALTYTKNGYEIRGSNNLFFDSSLNRLISNVRPNTPPPAQYKMKVQEPIYEPYVEYEPKEETKKEEKGLTVFLGGAGMRGNYQYDFIKALKNVGISNVVRGNYSAFFHGIDESLNEKVDIFSDSAAVIFYNQDTSDPIALQLVDTRGCEVEKEFEFLSLKFVSYKGKTIKNNECPNTYKYELETSSKKEFNLKNIQINEQIPKEGQFNFIGYSWGSIVAARTALEYAKKGIKVHNLVLIGSPINYSLLQSVQKNKTIENVIIINLTEFGDPIYAGMTDDEILKSIFTLKKQMEIGSGHFYYSIENTDGKVRRMKLSKELFKKGLR